MWPVGAAVLTAAGYVTATLPRRRAHQHARRADELWRSAAGPQDRAWDAPSAPRW
ncbi:hypothetical protein ACFHW1_07980 [Micromonospora sp. LOL_014]|uniref:hypothetical protein n=1 Tax=Micromonospora sp. LOL_014 TaxID=3345415 RepID=UPI003A886587